MKITTSPGSFPRGTSSSVEDALYFHIIYESGSAHMQLQGLMFILVMLIVIPIMILSANHNSFFIVMAIVLLIVSLRKMYVVAFDANQVRSEDDDALIGDLENALNVDIKKFGTGTKIVRSLIFILFFIYCIFYINSYWMSILALINILYWIYDIANNLIIGKNTHKMRNESTVKDIFVMLVNASTIILLIFITYNKFIGK